MTNICFYLCSTGDIHWVTKDLSLNLFGCVCYLDIYIYIDIKWYIPHLRNPAIWLVEIAVMILAIPVNKRKMPRPCDSSRVKFKLPGMVQSCLKTGLSERGYHTYVYVCEELVASLIYQIFNTERCSADDCTAISIVLNSKQGKNGWRNSPKISTSWWWSNEDFINSEEHQKGTWNSP